VSAREGVTLGLCHLCRLVSFALRDTRHLCVVLCHHPIGVTQRHMTRTEKGAIAALKVVLEYRSGFVVPEFVHVYAENGMRLMQLCLALQHRAGKELFFLASRSAAEDLHLHFTNISTLYRFFVSDGLPILVVRCNSHRASRYRMATQQ
jgi:hypothetical protein